MVERTFAELVKDLRMRRAVGDKPPVLLLGAGASVDSGIGAMSELYKFFGCLDFEAFCKYIGDTSAAERYRYLSDFLQTRKPTDVSPGYQALAALCAQNYFNFVLTTNMDPLLDDALAAARLRRRDYLLIVNGVIRSDRLELLLRGESPRVKVVKLHGDLFQRFMAWTPAEMDSFLTDIAPFLKPAVAGRDFLVVGYSLRDERVRELVSGTGGSIWFTHPEKKPEFLADKDSMRAVVAPQCKFEAFFPSLAEALQVEVPLEGLRKTSLAVPVPGPPADGAQTMDDLMSSVFAIAGPGGTPVATSFLLAEPRLIVCNRLDVAPLIESNQVGIIGPGGRLIKTQVLRTNTSYPFGPTLLAVPEEIQMPGLRLNSAALKPGDLVDVAVAAGEKTGISSGPIRKIEKAPVPIEPIGEVPGLVSLDSYVAPGACGGPVVDSSMAVRGYIVAGSSDPNWPLSFAYPSSAWAAFLRGERDVVTIRTSRKKKR